VIEPDFPNNIFFPPDDVGSWFEPKMFYSSKF
jgi:hypothetical protein